MDKSKTNLHANIEHLLYNSIRSNTNESFYVKDLQSRFIALSQYHANYFGLDSIEDVLGKTDFDFFTKEHAQEAFDDEQEIIRTQKPILAKIEKETWKDNYISYVITSKYPLLDDSGQVIGTWGHSINVATTASTSPTLKQKALHFGDFKEHIPGTSKIDPLTKLNNITSFYEFMNLFYQSAMNTINMPDVVHCIMIIDISNYALINAKHGQASADCAVQSVAKYLKTLQSSTLHAFRYSGDRFAVLFEDTSYDNGVSMTKSLIDALSELTIGPQHQTKIEVNVGLSQFIESLPLGNIYDIINLTDKRLYAAQKLLKTSLVYDDCY